MRCRFRLNSPVAFSINNSGHSEPARGKILPVGSGARPKACCSGLKPRIISRLLNALVASDRASLVVTSGDSKATRVISSFTPLMAFSHIPNFQCASPGIMSRKTWWRSQYSSTALLRKVPSGSNLKVSGSPKYWHQHSWRVSKNWDAPTWYFRPSPKTRPMRNLEPSSITSRN